MNVGDLVIDLIVNTGNLQSQLSGIKNALVGALSGIATGALAQEMHTLATEASKAQISVAVFNKTLQANGQDSNHAKDVVNQLAKEFKVMPGEIMNSATALLRMGATIDQVAVLFRGAGSSAIAYGRDAKAGFENVSSAVVTGTSALLNHIGIAENLGPYMDRYAKSIGKTSEELTNQERVMGSVQMVAKATEQEYASLKDMMAGLTGQNQELNLAVSRLRNELGTQLIPMVSRAVGAIADIAAATNKWLAETKNLQSFMQVLPGVIAGAVSAFVAFKLILVGPAGITAAIATVRAAMVAAFGPAGWAAALIGAAIGLVVNYMVKLQGIRAELAKIYGEANAEKGRQLDNTMTGLQDRLNTLTSKIEAGKSRIEALKKAGMGVRAEGEALSVARDEEEYAKTLAQLNKVRREAVALQREHLGVVEQTTPATINLTAGLDENTGAAEENLTVTRAMITEATRLQKALEAARPGTTAYANAELALKKFTEGNKAHAAALSSVKEAQQQAEQGAKNLAKTLNTQGRDALQASRQELETLITKFQMGTLSQKEYQAGLQGLITKYTAAIGKTKEGSETWQTYANIINGAKDALKGNAEALQKQGYDLGRVTNQLDTLNTRYELGQISTGDYRKELERLISRYTEALGKTKQGSETWQAFTQVILGAKSALENLGDGLTDVQRRLQAMQKESARETFVGNLGIEEVERRLALIPSMLKKAGTTEEIDDILSLQGVLENRKQELEAFFDNTDRILADFYDDLAKTVDKYHDMGQGTRTASTPSLFGIDLNLVEEMVDRAKGSVDDLTSVIDVLNFAMDTGQIDAQDYAQGIQWANDGIVDLTEGVDEFLEGAPLVEDHFDRVVQKGPDLQKTLEDLARTYENLAKAQEVVFGRQSEQQFQEWEESLKSGTLQQLQGYRQLLEEQFNAVSTTPDSTGFIDLQLQDRLKRQLDALDSVIDQKQKDLSNKAVSGVQAAVMASLVKSISLMAPTMDLAGLDEARQALDELVSKGFGKTEQEARLLALAIEELDQRFADLTTNWDELIAQADQTPEKLGRVAVSMDEANQKFVSGLQDLMNRDVPGADLDRLAQIRKSLDELSLTDAGKSEVGVQALAEAYQLLDEAVADLTVDFDLLGATAENVPDHFTRVGQKLDDLNQKFVLGIKQMVQEGLVGADLPALEALREKILSLTDTPEGKSDAGMQAIAEGIQLIDEAVADLTTDWEALGQEGEDVIDRWNRVPDLVEKLNQRSADALAALVSSSLEGATLESLGELRSTIESLADTDFGKSQTGMQAIAEALQTIDEATADLTVDWEGLGNSGEDVIDHWNRVGETAEQVSARWQATLDNLYAKIDEGTEDTLPGIRQGIEDAFKAGQLDQQQFDLLMDALLAKATEFDDLWGQGELLAAPDNIDDMGFRTFLKNISEAEQATRNLFAATSLFAEGKNYLKRLAGDTTPEWERFAQQLVEVAQKVDDPLKTNMIDLAGEIRRVGKEGDAFETLKDRVNQVVGLVRQLAKAIGGELGDALGQVADLGMSLFNGITSITKGDIFGGVVTIASGVIGFFDNLINGARKAREEAEKLRRELEKNLTFIDVNYLYRDAFTAFGAPIKVLDDFRKKLAESIQGGFAGGVSAGIRDFLRGTGDMLTGLKQGLQAALEGAIIDSIINGAIIKGALGTMLGQLTEAIASGNYAAAAGITQQIAAALPALAANLEQVLSPLKGVMSDLSDSPELQVPGVSVGALPVGASSAISAAQMEGITQFGNHVASFGRALREGLSITISQEGNVTATRVALA